MIWDGFLGEYFKELQEDCYKKYKEIFGLYEEFNNFLHTMSAKLSSKYNDLRGIVILTVFSKAIKTFQSIYILFRNCLASDGACLTRVLFEEMLIIGYCCKGEKEFKEYIALEIYKKIKLHNIIDTYPDVFETLSSEKGELKRVRKLLEEKRKELGSKTEIKKLSMAREIGIPIIYETFYRKASDEVHTNPIILDEYCNFEKDGALESLSFLPRIKIIPKYFLSAMEFMVFICKFLSGYFGIPDVNSIEKYSDKLRKLDKHYTKNGEWL